MAKLGRPKRQRLDDTSTSASTTASQKGYKSKSRRLEAYTSDEEIENLDDQKMDCDDSSICSEMSTKSSRIGKHPLTTTNTEFKFRCKTAKNRAFELQMRERLLEMRKEFDLKIHNIRSMDNIEKSKLSQEFLNYRLKDLVEMGGGDAPTFLKLLAKLRETAPVDDNMNSPEIIDSPKSKPLGSLFSASRANPVRAPIVPVSVKKMNFMTTPVRNTSTLSRGTPSVASSLYESVNKRPRLNKPGEILYSARGSPIHTRKVPDLEASIEEEESTPEAPRKEKIKIADPNGKEIEVEIVLLAKSKVDKDVEKLYREFVTDVRGVASTRSTVAKNRILPSRVPRLPISSARKGPSTRKVNKPTWHY